MQCILKFLELMPQSPKAGALAQKLAVKLPAKDVADTPGENGQLASGFAAIMAALMRLPADQLNRSLEQLERVPMKGDTSQMVPLIDLSNPTGKEKDMLKWLLDGSGGQKDVGAHAQGGQTTAALVGAACAKPQTIPKAAKVSDLFGNLPADNPSAADKSSKADNSSAVDISSKRASGRFDMRAMTPAKVEQTAEPPSPSPAQGQPSPADTRSTARTIEWSDIKAFQNMDAIQAAEAQKDPPGGLKEANIENLVQTVLSREDGAGAPADKKKAGDPNRNSSASRAMGTNNSTKPDAISHAGRPAGAIHAPNLKDALDDFSKEQHPTQRNQAGNGNDTLLKPNSGGNSASQSSVLSHEMLHAAASQWNSLETGQEVDTSKSTQEATAESRDTHTDLIRQIVQRMTLLTDGRHSQMQISLKPEYLGNLHMEIMTENQDVTIRMTAENHHVKEIIEHNIHMLSSELQQQGLHIQKVEVSVAPDGNPWRGGQQQMAFRQAQDHHQRQDNRRHSGHQPPEGQIGGLGGTISTAMPAYAGTGEVDFFA